MGIRCTGSRPLRTQSKEYLFRFLDGREQWHSIGGEPPPRYSLIDETKVQSLPSLRPDDALQGIAIFKRVYVPVPGKILRGIEYREIESSEGKE